MITSAPPVENVPVAKLMVDPDVQRVVDKTRVDKMVKDYQPSALGAIVVSRRSDGTHHVVDGQHRVQATIAAGYGDGEVTCLVYEGLTRSEEAALFRRLNNSRSVNAVDKFRVRVVEGDDSAVQLNALLGRHGWTVAQDKNDGYLAGIAALERVHVGKVNGPGTAHEVTETLIQVITEAWGHDANGVRGEITGGLGALLLRFGTRVDRVKLVSELRQFPSGPLGLVGRAKGLRDFRGGLVTDAVAEVVVELLNKNRRTNKLPDWRSAA